MKWTNRGHEYDGVYAGIKEKSAFFLFGAGEYGQAVSDELGQYINIAGFVDNDISKQNTQYCDKPVLALHDLNDIKDPFGVIITVSPNIQKSVIAQMMSEGFCYNKDFYTMETFLSVYFAYELNKLYIPSISFLPSTKCNLNCEACLNFTPYLKHPMIREWDEVKNDIDLFFKCVDYVMLFHISGGEPFLYPHLDELIEYIGRNYRNQIHYLRTVTNGTVMPKMATLELLKQYDVELTLDDYRDEVPRAAADFNDIIAELNESGVKYEINKVDSWIDLAPLTTDHSDWSEKRLQKHFEGCHVPWRELRGGKIYSCNYASYAEVAGLSETQDNEVYDLASYDRSRLKELMEFRLGYNEKGYVEFCRHCSGYIDINDNPVVPAKQKDR